ncbi:class I SAM-dependent methyltransferase [Klugiella xanthotipulae]|uniref:2-polyprenyl-3-methyl-5-hydroxy-6-metoxy-1, 4-benzoquinol methylase n=1 Tax=Klugiella xanthotipulae TaxID=244735 RepID=A0A543I613_9MICO|nr:methyltransferase domain-containing protein [Klugiella xanthotipulae]TQM66035.1 2-polyprenyl-3-methyl-5-hydroxy-6-metoxy-1,4-benzoquinol methylase [Klugiella xanthotipulae]
MTLRVRHPHEAELMDDPACDPAALWRTYRQFRFVNGLVAGWRRTYRHHIRPHLTGTEHTLLDVGTGGGDLARAFVRWAARDGVLLHVTAIDPDVRAHRYVTTARLRTARARAEAHAVEWLRCTTSELVAEGRTFDVVVSNHVLHHLSGEELGTLLRDGETLAAGTALHSDIRRSRMAYVLFSLLTLPFVLMPPGYRSFIRPDGFVSIRRSFTVEELTEAVPGGWRVLAQWPYRLLLVHRHSRAAVASGGPADA